MRRRLESLDLAALFAGQWSLALAVSAAGFVAYRFATLSLDRHAAYQSNAYDLGFFDQIIWNTSRGRFFETSFVPYNFLGLHFDPILLVPAAIYRLGGRVETLLILQAGFVAAASIPLYLAVRRLTRSGVAALAVSLAFLLNPGLHRAVLFDFHPELAGFLLVFLALYLLAAEQPRAAIACLLPLLVFKEDMGLLLLAFALVFSLRGYRREARVLAAVGLGWSLVVAAMVMPLVRGGSGDGLAGRYAYLVADSNAWTVIPHVVGRGVEHLSANTAPALRDLLLGMGAAPLLNPLVLATALPSLLSNGLADHTDQARLGLHYVMAPLAIAWVAAVTGLERLASPRVPGRRASAAARRPLLVAASLAVVAASAVAFLWSSPFATSSAVQPLTTAHSQALRDALALIPDDASVSAQSAVLPHLSARRQIFEFPENKTGVDYVVVDTALPRSSQSVTKGFDAELSGIEGRGYRKLYSAGGLTIFERSR